MGRQFALLIGIILLVVNVVLAQESCQVSAGQSVNIRSEPSTAAAVVRTLAAGESQSVSTQTTGADGFPWFELTQGGWVRSDVIRTSGNCDFDAPTPMLTDDNEFQSIITLLEQGEQLRITSQYADALSTLDEALTTAQEMDASEYESRILNSIGKVYIMQWDFESATTI